LVLKTHSYDYIRVDDKDFYKDAYRFRIELTFEDLIPEEAKNFTEWLGWNCLGLLIHGLTPYFLDRFNKRF